MKIVKKNQHLEVATALLRSKSKAQELLRTLEQRPVGSFRFVTSKDNDIEIVVLAVFNQGATVTILSTEPTLDREIQGISELIGASLEGLLGTDAALAQTVFPVDHHRLEHAFAGAGFHRLAILNYMELARSALKQTRNRSDHVRFSSMLEHSDHALGLLMLDTFQGSLDCPKIHGLRRVQDIIDGHRAHGEYDAQLWFIAEVECQHAAVLLLNPIQEMRCMELAYLGVAPWARGKGIGHALIQHAVTQSSKYGMPRITLAVDALNTPAICLYKKWNFHKTKERCTMIRKLY